MKFSSAFVTGTARNLPFSRLCYWSMPSRSGREQEGSLVAGAGSHFAASNFGRHTAPFSGRVPSEIFRRAIGEWDERAERRFQAAGSAKGDRARLPRDFCSL